jgi:hypothetical protein
LLVTLKYGKKHAKNIKQILKLPQSRKAQAAVEQQKEKPEPAKERSSKSDASTAPGVARKVKDMPRSTPRPAEKPAPVSKSTSGAAPKTAEKRPRAEDDAATANPPKRPKPSQEGTSTPTQRLSSPALSNKSSAQKSQGAFATPRKDVKATNMLRTSSAEGNTATPGQSGGTPSNSKHVDVKATPTPTSTRHAESKAAPSSTPLSARQQADYEALSKLSWRLNTLGRSLKHSVPEFTKWKDLGKQDNKRFAIAALECVICYMASFGVKDLSHCLTGRPITVDNTWLSLVPLTDTYVSLTGPLPHLEGLRQYLLSVIRGTVCYILARHPSEKSQELSQDTTNNARRPKNPPTVSENFQFLVKATVDASIALPLEDIQAHYPKTWKGRETDMKLKKVPEKPGNLSSGPYFLPISVDTTPFQAVQFGLAFLAEYCEKEKLDYKLRVSLDRVPE